MVVYKNPYRRLTHEDNHTLGFSLAGMLSWRKQKIIDGKIPKEEIKIIEETNQRLTNIVNQLEEARMSELSRDKVTKSNFDVISIEDLHDIYVTLNADLEHKQWQLDTNKIYGEDNIKYCKRQMGKIKEVMQRVKGAENRQKKKNQQEEHIGETALCSDGKTKITIIKWNNKNNIMVQFEDGRVISGQTYSKFKNDKINSHDDYIKKYE